MKLSDELRLRHHLIELRAGDETTLVTPSGGWRIRREIHRFRVTEPGGYTHCCPRVGQGTVSTALRLRRAVSEILALLYGPALTPEMAFPNVARVGRRYAAYHVEEHRRFARLVAYADSPEAAYERYDAWLNGLLEERTDDDG